MENSFKMMGYRCTEADHAVSVRGKDKTFSIIALCVKEITMVSQELDASNRNTEALKRCYQMTDLGELTAYTSREIAWPAELPFHKRNTSTRSWSVSRNRTLNLSVHLHSPKNIWSSSKLTMRWYSYSTNAVGAHVCHVRDLS